MPSAIAAFARRAVVELAPERQLHSVEQDNLVAVPAEVVAAYVQEAIAGHCFAAVAAEGLEAEQAAEPEEGSPVADCAAGSY